MNGSPYLKQRQYLWAKRHDIRLQDQTTGPMGEQVERAYTQILSDNLYEPLIASIEEEFKGGDGGELDPSKGPRMSCLYSSSATAVNFFGYWKKRGLAKVIAEACKLPAGHAESIRFEQQFSIAADVDRKKFPYDPNLDVVINYGAGSSLKVAAIECKFNEPYGGIGKGISKAYLDEMGCWEGLSACKSLAETICPDDTCNQFLHAAQLIKHILSLNNTFGRGKFRSLYLWTDVPGHEGSLHRKEIERSAAGGRTTRTYSGRRSTASWYRTR